MAKKQLTATVSVIIGDEIKPIEELTKDEKEQMLFNMRERLTETMSLYYSNHIDELRKLNL